MTFPDVSVPKSVYELCWNNAQDATIAVESSSGLMIDANPAAEAMMGYSRQGKRILIPQQMQEVVIVPPCFEAFPVDTAF
jgi:PAS domain S-box-containing protein